MTDRFKTSLVNIGKSFSCLVYDFQKKKIVSELTDYADELISNLHLVELSIKQEIGYLKVFWSFLNSRGIDISTVSDEFLQEFREYALSSARSSPSHRDYKRDGCNQTVNAKLIRVYDWLMWMQETGRAPLHTIGSNGCSVKSALRGSCLSKESKSNKEISSRDRYPMLLQVSDRNSKHKMPKFIPSEEMIDALHRQFFDCEKHPFIKHRNVLLIDIAAYTGFRRNSIQSLHIDQFTGNQFKITDRDTVIIRPSRQKMGYGDTYEIPAILHEYIVNFINSYRLHYIQSKGLTERDAEGAVFISERTCRPLTDGTMTAIVSKAFKLLGAPKGVAIHSFRAKYLVETHAEEYDDRKKMGLTTSPLVLDRATAFKVGHRNVASQRVYREGHEASLLVEQKAKRMRKNKQMEDDINRLREENLELRNALGEKNAI